ncbi:MAG: choice-of-anchor J domain-containing protein [Melioribacteraceae bacterium]|nr:choice-of-anchor J domain-containing protein [Melioribacteraceae bacterium]
MKRVLITLFLLISISTTFGQLTKVWEKSALNNNLPSWFDTSDLTRGFAYGNIDGNDRILVASRNGGNNIYILDGETGDSLGILDATGVNGGIYHISDVAVSEDGVIFVCNLSINGNLKVYKWESESATAVNVVDEALTGRFGDKFSVSGSLSDNSAALWFASSNSNDVAKFTTDDNGASFTVETIDVGITGGSASVGALNDGSFYYNATGLNPKKFDTDGNDLGTVSGEVVSTSSNSIRYITDNFGNEYFVSFQYGEGNENAKVVKVIGGVLENAATFVITSSMRVNNNANGTGDVAVKDNKDGTFQIFVLSTNNGIQAFTFSPDPMDNVEAWTLTDSAIPSYFSGNTERGMTYANGKVYVVSRNGETHNIFVHNAATGELTDTISAPSVRTGYFPVNAAESTGEGDLLVCNMTLNANEAAPFMVYSYNTTEAKWDTLLSYAGGDRLGDMFSAYGSLADNSLAVYAAASGTNKVVKFTTSDNGASFTATEITLADITLGSAPNVAQANDGTIYVKSYGNPLVQFNQDGSKVAEVSTDVVGTGISKIKIAEIDGVEYLFAYLPDVGGNGGLEKVALVNITEGAEKAEILYYTPSIGNIVNGNGTGSIDYYQLADGTLIIYLLGTNNGIAAFDDSQLLKFDPMVAFTPWSLTGENIPSYFGSNTERGMAYGDGKVYVVSRNGSEHFIQVHSAITGDSLDAIPTPAARTGYFPVNCAEYTDDGKLLVCNMTLNANEAAPFMVYSYNTTDAKWDTLLSYTGGARLGDMFSSYGSLADNSIAIYAAASGTNKVVKFTTADNGANFTSSEITLADLTLGSVPNVAQANDGTIYVKSYGNPLIHFNADGSLIDTIATSIVATGATKVVYKDYGDGEVLLAYLPDVSGNSDLEKVAVINLTEEGTSLVGYTPSIGVTANGNGTGSVDYKFQEDGTLIIFILGANNGLASFTDADLSMPILALSELNEDFEGEWLTEGWVTFAANVEAGNPTEPWAQSSYKPYTGANHAYMANYNTKSDCYLVTPALKLDGDLSALHFFVQDDWNTPDNDFGSMLKVMVSTGSQTDASDFVVIDSVKESDCYDVVLNKVIDLSAIEGKYAYIAFVVPNFGDPNDEFAGGDNWIIDNIRMDSTFTDISNTNNLPNEYALEQNYPNPFNPATVIKFSLKVNANVTLKIYNVIGQEVKTLVNRDMAAGTQSVNFNALNLSSGMYIYRLEAVGIDGSKFMDVRKMMLLK